MRIRQVITVMALLLGLNVAAHADILATGMMYGGPTQNNAICYLFNAGTGPVTVVNNQIIRQSSDILPLTVDNCGVLAVGTTCAIAVGSITNGLPHACRFVLSPSGADVRGVLEIRAGGIVLQNSELR